MATCIEFACPIGYHATWSYLEAEVGRDRKDPAFLEPALDLLEAQLRWHGEIEERYARLRRQQKRRGRRRPAPDEVTPRSPRRWHGNVRVGALHVLADRLRRGDAELAADPVGRIAVEAAEQFVATDGSPIVDVEELQRCLDWARRQVNVIGWAADHRAYRKAGVSIFLLGQVHLILHGPPVVGTAWNFVEPPPGEKRRTAGWHLLKTPVGLWRSAPKEGTAALVEVATDLLVLGHDTPALRELAGMSPSNSAYDVEPVVHRLLAELGLDSLMDGSPERAGLEARLESFLDGERDLRDLSRWAHSEIGHEGEEACQPFVLLDDIYDDWEYAGHDLEFLEITARRAANDFLAGRAVTRLDWLTPPTSS